MKTQQSFQHRLGNQNFVCTRQLVFTFSTKGLSFYKLNANMHHLKRNVRTQVIRIPVMFRINDSNVCIIMYNLTEWITFSYRQNVDMCSRYQYK